MDDISEEVTRNVTYKLVSTVAYTTVTDIC